MAKLLEPRLSVVLERPVPDATDMLPWAQLKKLSNAWLNLTKLNSMAKLFLLSAIKKAHRLHQRRVVVAVNAVQVKNQSQRTKEQKPMKLEPPLPKMTQMTTPKNQARPKMPTNPSAVQIVITEAVVARPTVANAAGII